MRTGSYRAIFRHYVLDLAVASFIPLMATACAARQSGVDRPRPGPAAEQTLAFETSTTEPVSVYIEERGSQWFVGNVLAGQDADLRLPAGSSLGGREFTLVVVPASARRALPFRSGMAFPGPITVGQLRGEYLTNVRWKLVGNWVIPLPIPPRP